MKKIEKQIKEYAAYSVPNVLDDILKQKGTMTQEEKPRFRFKLVGSALMIPLVILLFIFFTPTQDIAASTLTLDFETSIALDMDDDDRILQVRGINESGIVFARLIKENIEYESLEVTEFLLLMYDLASESDYLKEETTILYAVESNTSDKRELLAEKMADHFENLPPQARPFKDIYETAINEKTNLEPGISISRMSAIKIILDAGDLYTFNDLKTLTNDELIQIIIDLELELPEKRMPGMRP